MLRKKVMTAVAGILLATPALAQFTHGTTGLLNMPTADMQKDKTLMVGGARLSKHATPYRWNYDTYNYYVNVTFFPWLEVAYTMTIFDEWVTQKVHMMNQDRNFSGRLRLWKEGWWKSWTPQIVAGVNDVTSGSGGDYLNAGVSGSGNGYFSRYYLAATKHIAFDKIGTLGVHATYLYNKRTDTPLNAPAVGLDFRWGTTGQTLTQQLLNGLTLMAEAYPANGQGAARDPEAERGLSVGRYDLNIGGKYAFWKERINVYGHLYGCRYPSIGLYLKVQLK